MGYNTEGTDWPHGDVVSEASKDLIDRFFSLLDREDDDAAAATVGDVLADEIFAPSGQAHFHGQVFAGPEEIRKSRDHAWKVVSRRRHRLIKVYSAGVDGHDLLFIGHVEMDFRNGRGVAGEFTGRLVIDQGESEQGRHPKLLLYQVWADSAPVTKALKGE